MPKPPCYLAATDELKNGEMKQVEAEGTKILLARIDEQFHATGAECPHYGAPLAEGLLCGDRLICPWHKSVFRITDGTLLDPPALDGLKHYEVFVEADRVYLRWPESEEPAPSSPKASDSRCFVLAGVGGAGTAAASHLRELGFTGRIVAISAEKEMPYDRPALSKEFLSGEVGPDMLPLRPPEFWDEQRIECITDRIVDVKPAEHHVVLSNAGNLSYDRLLIATGGTPRTLEAPGADLGNIFTLRSEADAQAILKAAQPGVRVVVVGGNFIALEVAAALAHRKLPVTAVVRESVPFAKGLGPEVGRILQKWHEDHGVVFRLKAEVASFEGQGTVRHVQLKSGERLPADLVVIGAGVQPATAFLQSLRKREDGGLTADSTLRITDDIFAAGDIAAFPETYSGQTTRIEHWRVALQQGRAAAANMLGTAQDFNGVPYFWTRHFDESFEYVGHAEDWDDLILQPGDQPPAFLAFYIKGERIVAAAACQRDKEIAALHELLRLRRVPSPVEVRSGVDLIALARSASV